MIETKAFQVRDAGTNISIVAFKAKVRAVGNLSSEEAETKILARAGFHGSATSEIVVVKLSDDQVRYDPFGWPAHGRTMKAAHMALSEREHPDFIRERFRACAFDQLESGSVIDVEWLLGETNVIKEFE